MEWFDDNCERDEDGDYYSEKEINIFALGMTEYCGKNIEVDEHDMFDDWYFSPWMYDVVDDEKEIAETLRTKRKVIQISESISDGTYRNITALCDDGTVWKLNYEKDIWVKLPDIPQD